MNFKIQASPHIRTPNASVSKMMLNVVIAMVPLIAITMAQFKLQFLYALILSIVTVCGLEALSNKIMKREQTLVDGSALVTAIIFALTLPSGIFNHEFYGSVGKAYMVGGFVIVASATFAIVVGKMVFGGLGRNIFNPAGLGRVFLLISFGSIVSYFAADVAIYETTATPLGIMKSSIETGNFTDVMNVTNDYSVTDMFFGRTSGSFGETSALALIFVGAYLMVFKIADWRKIVTCIGTFALLAYVYTLRVNLDPQFVIYQLLTGSILFGAILMVTDPVTAPITAPGRVFYAMAIGGLTFVIRIFGAYPEGMLLSILILNMFTPAIDYHRWMSTKFNLGWIITIAVTLAIFVGIVLVGTM